MIDEEKKIETTLRDAGLPRPAEGEKLLDARWRAEFGDWWVKTASTWWWWDTDERLWKSAIHGPR